MGRISVLGELVSPTLLHSDEGDIVIQKETFYQLRDRRVFLLDDSGGMYKVIKAIKIPEDEETANRCS
jgi:hypothetical protein